MTSQAYWNEQRKKRGCKKLNISSGQWSYIKRVGTILNGLYTNECNGFYDSFNNCENIKATKRNERKIAKFERIAKKFASNNDLDIYLQTDPRGATIYLDTEKIPENNYTKAVCIY